MAVRVSIEGVTKTFGKTRAVDNVTLAIAPGELFFLLGPSGCGKTTLLRCIAGFGEPDSGCIRVGDEDITHLPPHRRDTGMVFQSYALWPHMTVRDNVGFGLEMRKVPRPEIAARVAEALELVRIADRATAHPGQLSGGQQQRVALARALVVRPRCLLLDEPLSNLDAKLRLEMRTEIRRICKEAGITAIYVTHDQKEALSIADRMAVLHEGRVRQIGAPREVYLAPADTFVAGFIGEVNLLPGRLADGAVETGIGRLAFAAPPPAGVAAGSPVTVSLRPEAIRFTAPPVGAPNRFDAGVHHTVYLGEVAQHQVSVRGGDGRDVTLKAFETNPRIVARDGVQAAAVWVDPADVIVLKE